jgi:hypothetical protein
MNALRIVIAVCLAAILVCACERVAQPPQPARPARAAFIPTQKQLDDFVADGKDATLRKIAAVDYLLHFRMMQATGIEKELGGEAQAIAALQALGNAYERRMRAAEAELPKMIPAAFTGEGMTSGFTGMTMGSFLGMMTGSMTSSAVSSMSDAQLTELSNAGAIKSGNQSGALELQVDADGSVAQSMEFEVNENGINGKVKVKARMTACPDPNGKVEVEIDVDSQMTVQGKSGTGGYVHSTFKYERYVDDDAHLIDTADGSASSNHIRLGGFENFERQFVDITVGHERGGNPVFEHHGEGGFSIFRPDEVERAREMLQAIELLQTLIAEAMLRGIGSKGGPPWESGHCINLTVTSSPAQRLGVRPSTAFDLEAMPRAKSDGMAAHGTVVATLNGGSSLRPAGVKVKADAKYGYSAPVKKNETAAVAFESRSKRGVGRATLDFDTKAARAYLMEGGATGIHFSGQVCSLEEDFGLISGDVTVLFQPQSRQAGRYSYSGSMSGLRVHGHGTYQVKFVDDVAVSITAQGPGTVETPHGPQTGDGTEHYTLKPLGEMPCTGPPI